MKKINTLAALIFILGTLRIFSQDIDTSNFFPYKTGDMWEYFFDAGGPDIDTVQTITVSDSTDQEGKIHITQISRHINPIHTVQPFNYIIDTVNNYVYGMSGVGTDEDLLFKLDGIQGDQWIVYKPEEGGFEMTRIERIYKDTFLGINTTVKGFFYYATGDSTDTTGYVRGYNELAGGFGIVSLLGSEGGGNSYLIGAVINGVLYGDTTQVITSTFTSESNIPEQIQLYQNYPNPFNPTTKIRYEISKTTSVKLKVVNLLGEEVSILVNEVKYPGSYETEFNASQLSSGVFFAILQTPEARLTQSMLLIK
jgi:hypothetical protein